MTRFGTLSCSFILALSLGLAADELGDLLDGSPRGDRVIESEEVRGDWSRILDLLADRKYEEGLKELERLGSAKDFVTPRRRDFTAIARQVIEFPAWLEKEKDEVRAEYAVIVGKLRQAESALNALDDEEWRAKLSDANIPAGTRQRIEADRRRWQAALKEANAERTRLQKAAEGFKSTKFDELERAVGGWIDADNKGEDIETAYILSTTFLDCVGDSEVIRQGSQNLERKRTQLTIVRRIVTVIEAEVTPLLQAGKTEAARHKLNQSIARVQASEMEPFVKATATDRAWALFPSLRSVITFKLDSLDTLKKDWRLKGEFTADAEGLKGPRANNELESLFKMKGDFEVAISFTFGGAKFTNTGGSWIKVCGQRLQICRGHGAFNADLKVQRKGSKLIFTNFNGEVSESQITPEHIDAATTFFLYWRSRTSHFRLLKVSADEIVREAAVPGQPDQKEAASINPLLPQYRDQWKIGGGEWAFEENKLVGQGKGGITLTLEGGLPKTLDFKLTVVRGMRPRIKIAGTTLANEGYKRTLALYPRENVEHVTSKPNSYGTGAEIGISLVVRQDGVSYYRDGELWERRTYEIQGAPEVRFSCGDGWSAGAIEISDLLLKYNPR